MEITDDMRFQKKAETDLYNTIECIHCKKKITYDELLTKYDEWIYSAPIMDEVIK